MKKEREEKYDFETTELETDELSLKINRNVKSKKKNDADYYSEVTESEKRQKYLFK